ncbi:hypothetical protein G3A43_07085 [Paraburkholderia aspalathi]|nr:hypothetical protein [Paraburkholderia aspalathi]MBK3780016.1 hypothetical protein [Paraburkholderia aspalathi]
MTYLSIDELNLMRELVQAAEIKARAAASEADKFDLNSELNRLIRLDSKLKVMAVTDPSEPDLWVCEQHGELVSIPGYMSPDTSVYKTWLKARYIPQ